MRLGFMQALWPMPLRRLMMLFLLLLPALVVDGGETVADFDAAPFGLPLPEGSGLMWEDPREIHSVAVDFAEALRPGTTLRLEYWGSHWPKERLPKDREPGGGDEGWVELGNWYKGEWRVADTEQTID